MKILKKLKALAADVESSYKVASAAVAAGLSLVAIVVGSRTLATVVTIAAFAALLAAFIVTVSVYRGASKEACLKRRTRFLVLAVAAAVVAIVALVIVDPDIAKLSSLAEHIREILFSAMLIFNVLMGLATFGFVYGATAAMVLSSRHMWTRRAT